MPTIVAPDEALLGVVVEQVWSSMLHRPVLPWLAPWPSARAGVLAEIAVTGDCTCVVRLWCADSAAVSMTRAMLTLEDGADPVPDDVEDAIGEVLNVVTGALKGALGGTSSLGLPRVAAGPSPELDTGHLRVTVDWHDDDPVLISITPAHPNRTDPLP